MRVSLQTRLLLLIAGTVSLLSLIILGVMATLMGREIDKAARRDMHTTGTVLSQMIRERGAALLSRCQLLAGQPALKSYVLSKESRNDWATVSGYASDALKELHASSALITDPDGHALGETDHNFPDRSNRGNEKGVASSLQGKSWSGITLHGGKPTLCVSVPVVDPVTRYVQATLTAYSEIDSKVAGNLKGATGSEVAFTHNGEVVGASLANIREIDTPDAPRIISLHGIRYLALYAPLPETDLKEKMGFVTLTPYDSAMSLAISFRNLLILISAVALMLALATGLSVAQGITGPLGSVVDAAKTLQNGGWPERLDSTRTDEIGLLQSVFNDMTSAMRASQERLLLLIDKDPLTELDNHRRFQERLSHEVTRCARSGEPLAMLLIDIDHFQQFNHRYGHAAGDNALKRIAEAIKTAAPTADSVARYGGEEFGVLLPQTDMEAAELVGETIRKAVKADAEFEEQLSVSVGLVEAGPETRESDGLALAAELAVSRAKQLGRDRICRFESVIGSEGDVDPHQLQSFLKDGSIATIQALAAAVDAKDPYTQGHSERVAQYSRDLAKRLGMSDAEVDLIYITGTLHDVGKIGVPDAILKKPGRLEDEERAVMETHPVLGEIIVRKAPQLAATLPGVRHHHERWDGKGYPDTLAGTDIPFMARLLALADTYDAMTSDRPYRKGMAKEIALGEITKGTGTQFDPSLAPVFVEMMQEQNSPQEEEQMFLKAA